MNVIKKSLLLTSILLVIGFSYAYAIQEDNSMMMHDHMSNSSMMMHDHMSNSSMMMHDKDMVDNSMMKKSMMNTPMYQIKHGISIHDIKCGINLSLIFKASDGLPVCVKPSSVSALVARGWAQNDAMGMMDHTMTNMKNSMSPHDMMNKTMEMNDGHMMNKSMINGNETMKHVMPNGTMKEQSMPTENENDTNMAQTDEIKFKKAPGLIGITDYINTTPEDLQKTMKGKVILYDFWTFNCINCIHTIPSLKELNTKYADKGLLIIGVHSPETPTEKDPNNVRNAVEKYGIKYPVVLDTNFETWNAFGNHYWPRQYVVDPAGYIRYDNIGEGNYDEIENQIQNILAENKNA